MNRILHTTVLAFTCFLIASTAMQAQWKKITDIPPPYNSGTHWLDVYFLDSDTRYGWITGFHGYVIRTTDGGLSWRGSTIPGAFHLESVDFPTPEIGYVSGPAGVYKSIDSGVSWREITPPDAEDNGGLGWQIWGCFFSDVDTGLVVGGGCISNQQFFRTEDGGRTWTKTTYSVLQSGMTDAVMYSFGATGLGYASSSGRIWITVDGGRQWEVLAITGSTVWHEEMTNINQTFLVPVAGDGCSGGLGTSGGVRFSDDGGATWQAFTAADRFYGTYLLSEDEGWACGLQGLVYQLKRESDGEISWTLRNCGIDGNDSLDDVWFIDKNTAFVVGNSVYRSNFLDLPPPELRASGPLTFCEGDSVEITVQDGYDVYRWSTGEFTRSIVIDQTGTYTITASDETGCFTTSASVFVEVNPRPRPAIFASGATVLCEGEAVVLEAPPGYDTYRWSDGSDTESITVDEPGVFTVEVMDANGCWGRSDPVDVRIVPNPRPVITIDGLPVICHGEEIDLGLTEEYASYSWSNGATSPRITVNEPGEYSVTVFDANGCRGVAAPVRIRLRADADHLQLVSTLDNGVFRMADGPVDALICRELEFYNSSPSESISLSSAFLLRNIEFSLPLNQFPIVIQPGASVSLTVCFNPSDIGEHRDTLVLPEHCFEDIPLLSAGLVQTFGADGLCDTRLLLSSQPSGSTVYVSEPYPNPSGREAAVLVAFSYEQSAALGPGECRLHDAFGSQEAEGRYRYIERRVHGDMVFESGEFLLQVDDLPHGMYFLTVSMPGGVETRTVAITR